MKEFLKYLISQMVNHPDEVSIDESQFGENIYQYKIYLKPEDTGQIIGREGNIIRAIRNVAHILAIKEGKQIRIEIG